MTLIDEYVDTGISGAKDRRPELDRLLTDAHRRRFDSVVVWRFDRFARSVSHLLRALETFRSLGIEFVSLSEQVDTSTPAGKLVFTVLGAVAELERSLIAERVKAGFETLVPRESDWVGPEAISMRSRFSLCGRKVLRGGR
jgi:DNA invertase Pin-like site-specific DNA recombinase